VVTHDAAGLACLNGSPIDQLVAMIDDRLSMIAVRAGVRAPWTI
jgi:hypothetical protein